MRGTKEVLSYRLDLSAIADGDGSVVAVGVVVHRLLVVLKTFHEGEKVLRGPALRLEIV